MTKANCLPKICVSLYLGVCVKLSVITDEISMDFEHALDVMLEYGVKSAELRGLWDANIADLSNEQVAKAKSALTKRGMAVSCIASPFFKCDLDSPCGEAVGRTHQAADRSLDQQTALLERCIHLCRVFDTRLIRVFSFWKHGELTREIQEQIIQAFTKPIARAEEAGVILALENEHACYLGTGEETARVLRAVNSPALKAVWDPGNAFCAGETPYPDGYEAIREFVAHVHLKDPVRTAGGFEFVRMGEGAIDYMGQLRALEAGGYKDFLSLETHYKPGGVAENGSRECFVSLKEMLAKL